MNNFKRYKINVILVFTLIMTSCLAEPVDAIQEIPVTIWSINRETIDLHKKEITQQLIRNRYERVAIMCATAAVVAAGGWYALSPQALAPEDAQLTQDSNKTIASMKKTMNVLEQTTRETRDRVYAIDQKLGIKQSQRNAEEASNSKQSSLRWLLGGIVAYAVGIGGRTLDYIVLMILTGGLPEPIKKLFNFWSEKIEKVVTRVYHDSDFHWFVTKQTQAVSYFNDLERAAELLPLASDEEERKHQKDSMLWTADVLVKQLARVVAFMEYQAEKVKVLNTGCSIQMQASAKYMYRHIGHFAQTLQMMLEDRSKHAEIPAYIKSFRERLRSEQDSFCVNEHAALYDIPDAVVA